MLLVNLAVLPALLTVLLTHYCQYVLSGDVDIETLISSLSKPSRNNDYRDKTEVDVSDKYESRNYGNINSYEKPKKLHEYDSYGNENAYDKPKKLDEYSVYEQAKQLGIEADAESSGVIGIARRYGLLDSTDDQDTFAKRQNSVVDEVKKYSDYDDLKKYGLLDQLKRYQFTADDLNDYSKQGRSRDEFGSYGELKSKRNYGYEDNKDKYVDDESFQDSTKKSKLVKNDDEELKRFGDKYSEENFPSERQSRKKKVEDEDSLLLKKILGDNDNESNFPKYEKLAEKSADDDYLQKTKSKPPKEVSNEVYSSVKVESKTTDDDDALILKKFSGSDDKKLDTKKTNSDAEEFFQDFKKKAKPKKNDVDEELKHFADKTE